MNCLYVIRELIFYLLLSTIVCTSDKVFEYSEDHYRRGVAFKVKVNHQTEHQYLDLLMVMPQLPELLMEAVRVINLTSDSKS